MKETKYVDFHCHTFYSDGIESPEILVKAQKLAGLDIIAKTDHDNLEGYYEAKKAGKEWDLTVIPGVEFSAGKYHILGLGFNPKNREILSAIENSKALQKENVSKRIEILKDHGVPISLQKVEAYNPKSRLGKMNILFTMLTDPECKDYLHKNHEEVYKEPMRKFYLGSNGIAGGEEGMKDLEKQVIINSIHNAYGIAILAHPAKDVDDIKKELGVLRELGIDGLEVQPNYYSDYPPYIEYAEKHNLLITYGSDYHGPHMDRRLLGRKMNTLSQDLEERLKLNDAHNQTHERRFCLAC